MVQLVASGLLRSDLIIYLVLAGPGGEGGSADTTCSAGSVSILLNF